MYGLVFQTKSRLRPSVKRVAWPTLSNSDFVKTENTFEINLNAITIILCIYNNDENTSSITLLLKFTSVFSIFFMYYEKFNYFFARKVQTFIYSLQFLSCKFGPSQNSTIKKTYYIQLVK